MQSTSANASKSTQERKHTIIYTLLAGKKNSASGHLRSIAWLGSQVIVIVIT